MIRNKTIAETIESTREDHVLSHEDMAKLLGIEVFLLKAFANGTAIPNDAFCDQWREEFGFDIQVKKSNEQRLHVAAQITSGILAGVFARNDTLPLSGIRSIAEKAIVATDHLIDRISIDS